MISEFIPTEASMARRTINLPDSVETIAREAAENGESFSATVSRLIVQGAERANGLKPPSYTAAGEGPSDLGRRAEHYLQTLVSAR